MPREFHFEKPPRSEEGLWGIDPSHGRDELAVLRESSGSDGNGFSRNGQRLMCTNLPMKDQIALLRAYLDGDFATVERIQRRTKCGPIERGPLEDSIDFYRRAQREHLSETAQRKLSNLLARARTSHAGEGLASEIELAQERNAREDF